MWGFFDSTNGQGWLQLGELGLAFLLSALIGLEREVRQKSAGLRTDTLVGVSAALFVLVSKYGFMDVLENGRVAVDPSRVAAQVVSGIGFIGGGVIFMRRDVVRGLTSAASVWLTAALGMTCGAGLPVLAVATTAGYFVVMLVFPKLVDYLPGERQAAARLRVAYEGGQELLQSILLACAELRFAVDQVGIERDESDATAPSRAEAKRLADALGGGTHEKGISVLRIRVMGKPPVSHLIARLASMDGVVQVGSVGDNSDLE